MSRKFKIQNFPDFQSFSISHVRSTMASKDSDVFLYLQTYMRLCKSFKQIGQCWKKTGITSESELLKFQIRVKNFYLASCNSYINTLGYTFVVHEVGKDMHTSLTLQWSSKQQGLNIRLGAFRYVYTPGLSIFEALNYSTIKSVVNLWTMQV